MHVVSITYVYNSDDDRMLLFSASETPAKTEDEAEYVMYPEDNLFNNIVDHVTTFKEAEAGSEESITGTTEELLDRYGLDIEMIEEVIDQDLDGDGCDPLSPEHPENEDHGMGMDSEDMEVYSDPLDSIVTESKSYYTDPFSATKRTHNPFMGY